MSDKPKVKPKFVYVIYIASTPAKVWQALTDPDQTETYWFGYRVDAGGKVGATFFAKNPGGENFDKGVILESDPPRRLCCTWRPQHNNDRHERPSRVTFELAQLRGQVRLTVVHDDFDDGSKAFESISKGWPAVLSSLKSYLETGRALEMSTNDINDKSCVTDAAEAGA
jgi:uncharacterized protein YndB with AHSA1/START domain